MNLDSHRMDPVYHSRVCHDDPLPVVVAGGVAGRRSGQTCFETRPPIGGPFVVDCHYRLYLSVDNAIARKPAHGALARY